MATALLCCESCGLKKIVASEYTGKGVRCPDCGKATRVREALESQPTQIKMYRDFYPLWAALVQVTAWLILAMGTVVGVVMFFYAMHECKTVMQECACAASFATLFIAAYVFVRCVEKIVNAIAR
jgi:predicted RNA-binding Zn-ribbon protein involved in translation (DUF1610 family)